MVSLFLRYDLPYHRALELHRWPLLGLLFGDRAVLRLLHAFRGIQLPPQQVFHQLQYDPRVDFDSGCGTSSRTGGEHNVWCAPGWRGDLLLHVFDLVFAIKPLRWGCETPPLCNTLEPARWERLRLCVLFRQSPTLALLSARVTRRPPP